ncbi:serine/threonine-protein kinase [Streptomyces lushanensis]|uniref:serine/threonine-protein kinase n=1 Tax=Streptomyces lushanensis TaxID=1434255 RepID=UPI0008338828|nr:serine/threonine-protein kinase [Streptomyces lushanensis]
MALSKDDPRSIGGYRLVDRLGSGGMGVVYLGRSRSGREVAIKVVHAQYAENQVFRARFRREITAVRRVSGAFTAPVMDADPEAARPWMATQYVPGPSLADRIRTHGPLDDSELRRLALGLVEALRDIHDAGVVHRDLKPANVLMAQDGPRVIDFGISRAAENQTLTGTGDMFGTPPFMSPEQFQDPRSAGPASDVFSLAALLVYAATGRGPFDADSPFLTAHRVMNEDPVLDEVGKPLRGIVARCLAKEPAGRPELGELAQLLAALPESAPNDIPTITLGGGPSTAHTATAARAGRGRRLRPAAAATAGILALGLTVYLTLGQRGGDEGTANGAGARQSAGSPSAGSPSPRWKPVPSGWHPWQTTLYEPAATGVQEAVNSIEMGDGSHCVTDDDSVYCGGEGVLPVRIDARTGETVWRAAPARSVEATDGYTSSVIGVRNGSVLVLETTFEEGPGQADIIGLDAEKGRQLWAHPAGPQNPTGFLSEDLVLTMDEGEQSVTARTPRTGVTRWTGELPAGHTCSLLATDGDPYMLCERTSEGITTSVLLVFDLDDGTSRRVSNLPNGLPTGIHDGRIVFLDRRSDGTGTSLEDMIYTHADLFDPEVGGGRTVRFRDELRGTATLVDGTLYFVESNGGVTAVSPETGKRLWTVRTPVERLGDPLLDAGGRTLYLASESGRLVALDARTGKELWQTHARASAAAIASYGPRVLLSGGALVVSTPDGTVFTLDPGRPQLKAVPAVAPS